MKTIDQLIANDIRPVIGDTVATYRWSDAALMAYASQGRRIIAAKAPHSLYTDSVRYTEDVSDDYAAGDELGLVESFHDALASYVIFRALAETKLAGDNQTAALHKQIFQEAVG
jgi:hypothetical protein